MNTLKTASVALAITASAEMMSGCSYQTYEEQAAETKACETFIENADKRIDAYMDPKAERSITTANDITIQDLAKQLVKKECAADFQKVEYKAIIASPVEYRLGTRIVAKGIKGPEDITALRDEMHAKITSKDVETYLDEEIDSDIYHLAYGYAADGNYTQAEYLGSNMTDGGLYDYGSVIDVVNDAKADAAAKLFGAGKREAALRLIDDVSDYRKQDVYAHMAEDLAEAKKLTDARDIIELIEDPVAKENAVDDIDYVLQDQAATLGLHDKFAAAEAVIAQMDNEGTWTRDKATDDLDFKKGQAAKEAALKGNSALAYQYLDSIDPSGTWTREKFQDDVDAYLKIVKK